MSSKKTKGERKRTVRNYLDGDLVLSRCTCGSTERTKYFRRETYELPSGSRRHPQSGLPVTHVVYRYTRCKACRQFRRDRQFENRSAHISR